MKRKTVESGNRMFHVNPLNCHCCPHVETSQLICKANQVTGSYMRATLTFNGLKSNRNDVFARN